MGSFDDAGQGDEGGYISVIDTTGNIKSFSLGHETLIGENAWNDMKGKEIKVYWKMKRTYIGSIGEYRAFETAEEIEFIK